MAATAETSSLSKAASSRERAAVHARIRVWDAPVRLFHWIVVGLVITSWITAENHLLTVHQWSGEALLVLLFFRIGWGFLGSTTARFNSFVAGPKAVMGYFRGLIRGDKSLYAGHNPAGGWMVVALLTVLTLQAITGLFANDDIHFNGPLATLISKDASDSTTDVHAQLFNLILLLVWIHVVAVFFYRFVKGEDLIVPMLTGHKASTSVPTDVRLKFVRIYVAALLLVASVAIVWWLVRS
jgi:cytochrome b